MDVSSLIDSLSEDDVKKLKETAARFFGDTEKNEKSENNSNTSFPGLDPKLLMSVARFSSMLNEHDPRSDFLMALKPLLSESRKNKADEAAMLLKLFRIMSLAGGGK